VVLGGGFAGLHAARRLARAPVDVVVVDRVNHHLFQPLLYQVATAGLSPADIAYPIRSILRRQKNALVLLAEATAVDRAARRVVLDSGELPYDFLVVATGVRTNYFGHPVWPALAPGLKTVQDALEMRRRILTAFEMAERAAGTSEQDAWLTFVIVGGGPTGVELAGAICEIAREVLPPEFRRIDTRRARVIVVEANDRLLRAMDPRLSRKASAALARMGTEILTDTAVRAITESGVFIGDRFLAARTVLWTAGVQATPIAETLGVPLDGQGRAIVSPDLTVPGDDRVYVVGDVARLDRRPGEALPGLAGVAMQQGQHAAQNILRTLRGAPRRRFRYFDRGTMATIGRNRAVAEIAGLRFAGRFAWWVWLLVHILFLIGFRNRVSVLTQWAYNYLAFRRSVRLIHGPSAEPGPPRPTVR
jgi:NADH dehydrogenase